MFIESIEIIGFRNFTDSKINFNEGINVIIGHNNGGKSNLLKALALVLNSSSSRRLDIDDFSKDTTLAQLQNKPPQITITLKIIQSVGEDLNSDDLVTVANWLVDLQTPYTAILSYHFFLPETETKDYVDKMGAITEIKNAWNLIKHEFLRKYISRLYGGNPDLQLQADSESLSKFDFQFLDAIRDVERDMFTGRNTLLREVLDFFMDYEIKSDTSKDKTVRAGEIKAKKIIFSDEALLLLNKLQVRMQEGQKQILQYAHDTGASFNNATPDFDGVISETELYSALRLIIKYSTGIEIPATHNGLGYNNLIYMSLLLAKMQVDTNGEYLGSNAKVFPILVIEEPEAHLHPSMQYKFLKFLRGNLKTKARQVFVTTHSTHITSAVLLDEIICLNNTAGAVNIGYPGKVFSDSDADRKAKAYVQRFLDATRSDMLFAKGVIFVEGTAEQLLLHTFAHYGDPKFHLEDNHVAVINIGGRYFDYFLKLFDSSQSNTINKRISCITDRDPSHKLKSSPGERFKSCYPFEVGSDTTNYEYTDNAESNIAKYRGHPNIGFFSQPSVKGKTLEYEILLENPTCELLLTNSLSNSSELSQLMNACKDGKALAEIKANGIIRASEENARIIASLECASGAFDGLDMVKALIAARYLNSVGKGENALELAVVLEANLNSASPETFNVPLYIKQAIEWSCK